jgi:hypothetical protein
LDFGTVEQSVRKTHHLVTVETGWPFCGIGAELSAQISESETFDYLDAPVLRVTGFLLIKIFVRKNLHHIFRRGCANALCSNTGGGRIAFHNRCGQDGEEKFEYRLMKEL